MSRKDKGRIAGPFVPILTDTMKAPAWRAMSAYARVVYVALKSRYSFKTRNNGRLYLSVRQAAEETGLDKKTVARAFREMRHYGFTVMTDAGCLGVDGRGKAPHWRLTELGYMNDPPTKDFLSWNGELFHEPKSPNHYVRKNRIPYRRTVQTVPPDGTYLDLTTPPLEERRRGQGSAGNGAAPVPPEPKCAGCKPVEIDWQVSAAGKRF